ncbi:hypothetical protein [Streptomyces brasiliensis]|uniref:Tetratricopeptide repeat protein n=1 Tax=Streptomyces brasiliensis TaxID=1954 RepID=A0A917K8F7_9ACTN|nr:hypothetical protein [Streptomyces brasiliensis]GGJ02055.1 hypothetical protein GCM10010121_010500 [Streptomyces brasiliensis]
MPPPLPLLHPRRERPAQAVDRAENHADDHAVDHSVDCGEHHAEFRAPDSALGDTELIAARTALTQERHQAARALLLRTGDDWDRRGHRITVLAREPCAAARARDWLLAEPGSAGAATLFALALVHRALRGEEGPGTARMACREAAGLAPADPTPWLGLLLLERASGTGDGTRRIFAEVRARHPDHHHAHHLMTARLAERGPDRGANPDHEVYAFADECAARAPADSPLALLPVVAHTERYRVLAVAGLAAADPAASGHWSQPATGPLLQASFDWWLEWEPEDHPRSHVDLNFLAHALYCAGRGAEAAALFQRIDRYVTPAPWSYPAHDPCAAFHTARARALGTVAS